MMIKKSLLLASLLLSAQALCASGSVATLKYGLTSLNNDDGFDFSKHSFRVDAMYDAGYVIHPRVGLGYVSVDESDAAGGVTGAVQFDLEGVYEVESRYILTPYVFAGLGYEYVIDERPNFDSQFYLDAGLGLRYPLQNGINLVSELKGLQMLKSNSKQDAEFALYVGVGIPFGLRKKPQDSDGDGVYNYADMCANTPAGTPVNLSGCPVERTVVEQDSDHDSIPDGMDDCAATPANTGVNERGCPVQRVITTTVEPQVLGEVVVVSTSPVVGEVVETSEVIIMTDSDGDGVDDDQDQCADTPAGFSVNSIGCAVKKTLDVQFDSGSFHVTPASKPRIKKFAQFLKRYPNAHVRIVGYTDASGNRIQNKILSTQRAQSVKNLLITYGIPGSKITVIGKGDLSPIATNDTPEGREKNRRIEAEIK